MISNKKLMKFFHQECNIQKLEELIDESYERIKLIKEPQTEEEYKDYFKENKEIIKNKEANQLLDELVYPKILDLYSLDDIKKPKAKVLGNGFCKDFISVQDNGFKYWLSGNITMIPLTLALGAVIPEAIAIGSLPYALIMVKYFTQMKNVGGFVDTFFKKICYVMQDTKNDFVYKLAHEATHSIHGKSNSLIENTLSSMYLDYFLYSEGLAEAVANDVTFELTEGRWDIFRKVSSNRRNQHLLNSYHNLCDTLKIKENERKFHRNQRVSRDIYEPDMYDLGFTIIELIKKDKGKEITRKLIKNEQIDL